jgi:hypothetical protein
MNRRLLAVVMVAVTVGASDAAVAQARLTGSYALVAVNGQRVPAALDSGSADELLFESGRIDFRGDSAFRFEHTLSHWAGAVRDHMTDAVNALWLYRLRCDSIVFVASCPPNTHCPADESGVAAGDSVLVTSARLRGARLLYRRR